MINKACCFFLNSEELELIVKIPLTALIRGVPPVSLDNAQQPQPGGRSPNRDNVFEYNKQLEF